MSSDLLTTIAAKLEAGTDLTAADEAHMLAELSDGVIRKFYVATDDGGGDELCVRLADGRELQFDPWPSKNAQVAFDFADAYFPDHQVHVSRYRYRGAGWDGQVGINTARAPTPSAAIMAACIKAFLAKKGEAA